jgi:hypothetical protein
MRDKQENKKPDLRDRIGQPSTSLRDTDTVAVEQGTPPEEEENGLEIVNPGIGGRPEGQNTNAS